MRTEELRSGRARQAQHDTKIIFGPSKCFACADSISPDSLSPVLLSCRGMNKLRRQRAQCLAEKLANSFGSPAGGARSTVRGEQCGSFGGRESRHRPEHVYGA